jgi:hypothetical protein
LSLQTSSGAGPEQVTQFANPWHSRCLKCFEFENAIKKMNTSQNKIPIVEFGQVKFVLAVLLLKTDLNPATQQRERRPENITRRDGFAREWKILRAGSEGVSSFGPLVQSFRPRSPRLPKNSAKRLLREAEMPSY